VNWSKDGGSAVFIIGAAYEGPVSENMNPTMKKTSNICEMDFLENMEALPG
jgi:hypothetical protein